MEQVGHPEGRCNVAHERGTAAGAVRGHGAAAEHGDVHHEAGERPFVDHQHHLAGDRHLSGVAGALHGFAPHRLGVHVEAKGFPVHADERLDEGDGGRRRDAAAGPDLELGMTERTDPGFRLLLLTFWHEGHPKEGLHAREALFDLQGVEIAGPGSAIRPGSRRKQSGTAA